MSVSTGRMRRKSANSMEQIPCTAPPSIKHLRFSQYHICKFFPLTPNFYSAIFQKKAL